MESLAALIGPVTAPETLGPPTKVAPGFSRTLERALAEQGPPGPEQPPGVTPMVEEEAVDLEPIAQPQKPDSPRPDTEAATDDAPVGAVAVILPLGLAWPVEPLQPNPDAAAVAKTSRPLDPKLSSDSLVAAGQEALLVDVAGEVPAPRLHKPADAEAAVAAQHLREMEGWVEVAQRGPVSAPAEEHAAASIPPRTATLNKDVEPVAQASTAPVEESAEASTHEGGTFGQTSDGQAGHAMEGKTPWFGSSAVTSDTSKGEFLRDLRTAAAGPALQSSHALDAARQMVGRIELLHALRPENLVTVHLEPQDFGGITMVLKGRGERLDAELYVGNPQVRQALEHTRSQLGVALERTGYSQNTVHVASQAQMNAGSDSRQQPHQHSQQSSARTWSDDAARLSRSSERPTHAFATTSTGMDLWI